MSGDMMIRRKTLTTGMAAVLALALSAACACAEEAATNSLGMKLVRVAAGEFVMGSPAKEKGRRTDEPQRQVRITRDFWIGKFEVTRGQFRKFVDAAGYKTDA